MKTALLVLAGTVLLFASLPMVSRAEDGADWAVRSPFSKGEPMENCDIHHHDAVIAIQLAPALAADKVEAILTTPDVVQAVTPVKAPASATTQTTPKYLSPATLLTFALIASPGTAMPQTGTMSGTRD